GQALLNGGVGEFVAEGQARPFVKNYGKIVGSESKTFGVFFLRLEEEVSDGDEDEVRAAEKFHPAPTQQPRRRRDGEEAERERADEPIGERLALQSPGQASREQAEDQGVIDRQDAFEHDQQA